MVESPLLEKIFDGLLASSPGLVGVLLVVLVFTRVLASILQGFKALLSEERQERKAQARACHETHERTIERTEQTMREATSAIRQCAQSHGEATALLAQVARAMNGREFPPPRGGF